MENKDHADEAKRILEAIKADRFALRDHAVRRSDERHLSRQSVVNAAKTVIEWKHQADKFTHWFIGFLNEDRPGGFTAVLDDEGQVQVVTVFKRRLSLAERRKKNEG